MRKKGYGKCKFLPEFDREKAKKLRIIIESLQGCSFNLEGMSRMMRDLLERPSCLRRCDIDSMKEIFRAIEKV